MAKLDFFEKLDDAAKDLPSIEHMLGKGLMQPFSGANAGARKIMYSTHRDHVFPLINPEKAVIETGYEIRFGDYSSSVTKAEYDYQVIAKISKYSFAPNHHYWLIVKNLRTNELDLQERISYHHISEQYGYLYNNEYLDGLKVGDIIPNGQVVQKSLAFDSYNNRKDGINMNTAYLALDDNMEDSVILSDVAASKLTSPLVKPISIMINDNDIPLNIYGDDNNYKVIPDIGEEIKNANLIALRKKKKEEAFYNQSVERLKKKMMSDYGKQAIGRVIDINVRCNNPDILNTYYYGQIKMYYDELQRYSNEFVTILMPLVAQGAKMTYELQDIYANSKRVLNHDNYIDKRIFSNIILEVTVLEEKKMEAGDKCANRYGGKGVVSNIWPQKFMPRYKGPNGEWKYVDIIFNSSTMYNRENVGQVFELELNHISEYIIDHIIKNKLGMNEAYKLIHQFIQFCSPQEAEFLEYKKKQMSKEELQFYLENIIESGNIQLSMRPISDNMTIDKLAAIYRAFPWIEQNKIEVAIEGSDGQIRYVPSRRPIVVGSQYIFRLKQFAEEKFLVTSMSSTNIRNENTKSRAKKDFRELYSSTPVHFGNMEVGNLGHLGTDVVIANMMIHSVSPQGRRQVEQMYTGDPFDVDIKLTSDAKNRSAEIVSTYLKTIGRRMNFIKKRKEYKGITICPITFDKDPYKRPISFVPENMREGFDYEKDFKERQKMNAKREKEGISPIKFSGRRVRRSSDE